MDENSRLGRVIELFNRYFESSTSVGSLHEEFASSGTDQERTSVALGIVIKHADFLLPSEYELKNSEHSKIARECGNKYFEDGTIDDLFMAVRMYTESIVYAVESSEELALAYGNRSAAMFSLEKYECCVEDIDRALDSAYPDQFKARLYHRQGLCLKALGRPDANSSFQKALDSLDKMTLNKNDRDIIECELRKLIAGEGVTIESTENEPQLPLPKVVAPNPEVPCASDAVTINYSEKFGRHLVATRGIKPGEVLIVEKPYCVNLLADNFYTKCSHCLRSSWNIIPCKCCVNVAYCSEACRDKAWDKYHEIECPVFGIITAFDTEGMLAVALKSVLMATQKGRKLDSLKQELMKVDENKDPRTNGFGDDGKLDGGQYRSIYSLQVTVGEFTPYAFRSILAAITVYALATKSDMFGERLLPEILQNNPDVIFVGGLIFKQINIGGNRFTIGTNRNQNPRERGHALMAVCSLANHSCDPNAIRLWYPDHMVLVSAYPIEQGEQIFVSYALPYSVMGKVERQETLVTWNFNCECLACTEDWPLSSKLPSCKNRSGNPQTENKIAEATQQLNVHRTRWTEEGTIEKTPNTLEQLAKCIEIFYKLAPRPSRELQQATKLLGEFYEAEAEERYFDSIIS